MATLSFHNATKSFGNIDVIKGVDLNIEDREFVVFVGPFGQIHASANDCRAGRNHQR
jgi:ABC-type sugar transport system ATPase subunit